MPSRPRVVPVAGQVLWQVRYDLLAVVAVAAAMVAISSFVPLDGVAAVVPLLGVVVSVFIGFRNSNAFNRWWYCAGITADLLGPDHPLAVATERK